MRKERMERAVMKYPFEASLDDIQSHSDEFVDAIFSCLTLTSDFMIMPRGEGFVPYPIFEEGYETLKKGTDAFNRIEETRVFQVIIECPISFVVLRAILGFSPPEWAHVATSSAKTDIPQGFIRTLDRRIRTTPLQPLRLSSVSADRLQKLIKTACDLIKIGAPHVPADRLHRLDKADTKTGPSGMIALARIGVPYAMLLYERFLGRPFAGHRDSVSELVGGGLENAIEDVLSKAGIGFRKTRRAEKVGIFKQAPDFIIPDEFNPKVVIEAKITEDDGTARDKVTRIEHLCTLSRQAVEEGHTGYEVVACIGGRGFSVRREDMKKMILATRGKVFTINTLDRLVECSRLKEFANK